MNITVDLAKELFGAGRLVARTKAKYMKALLYSLSPIEAPGLGTVGVTEHGVLMVDWDFIVAVIKNCNGNLEKAALQLGGILVHECFHVLLNHCKRSRGKDPKVSNMADDMSFNPAIIDMGLDLPDGEFRGMFPQDFGWERGLTADAYYDLLMKQAPPKGKKGGKGQQGQGSGQPQAGQGSAPGQKPGQGGQAGAGASGGQPGGSNGPPQGTPPQKPKTGGGWCGSCAGNPFPGEPQASDKASRSKTEIERAARAVAQAVREEASQSKGTVPGFMQRWAEEMLAPAEIPWDQELNAITRHALAWRANAVDHRYDAPSRKQAGIGFGPGRPVLPRLRQPVCNVAVIADTSGSMGTDELSVVGREVGGILKMLGAEVTFLACDADVQEVRKVKSIKEIIAAMKGGGGTDMRPAIKALMKLKPRPDVIICLTDLHIGDVGPEPGGVKFVWVGVGEHAGGDPPWGKVLRVTKDKIAKAKGGEAA